MKPTLPGILWLVSSILLCQTEPALAIMFLGLAIYNLCQTGVNYDDSSVS